MTLFRNATSRLVAAHLGLVLLATGLILAGIYWRAGGVIDAEQRAVVESELRALADAYSSGGRSALAWAIDRRLEEGSERNAVFLLTDAEGKHLAGNLAAWPPTVPAGSGWVTLDLYRVDAREPTPISALTVALPRGEQLLVGRDVAARVAFDRTLWRALLAALLAMAGLALVTGWLLSRLVLRRIDAISADAGAIVAGALDRRIALTGSGDEFDRLADTLNAMLDRIELLVGDLRSLTDGLAHDLRRPIGRLVRHVEAVRAPGLDEAGRESRIEQALAEAETVLAMSSALIGISRVEAGIGIDQFEPVDLSRLAADVTELFEAAAEDRGLHLAVEAPPGPGPVVSGHGQLLAQALSNLVDNALSFAPAGSTVTVGIGAGVGTGPRLWVADHGPGIPPEARDSVTERFVRLDPSRGGDGSGLGLALVAAVARLHGATLALGDNAPGLRAELRFS